MFGEEFCKLNLNQFDDIHFGAEDTISTTKVKKVAVVSEFDKLQQ